MLTASCEVGDLTGRPGGAQASSGFQAFRLDEDTTWVRRGYAERLPIPAPDLESAFREIPGARPLKGRGVCWSVPIGDGERAVLRHYRHGGMLAPYTRDLFIGMVPRPVRELEVSERLRSLGLPTPEVLAVHWRRRAVVLYTADIITREVPSATDMATFLEGVRGPAGRQRRRQVLESAGRLVAKLHEAGLVHPDLNLRNLLVQDSGAGPGLWVLDLDRAKLARWLSPIARCTQLRRLARSVRKLHPWVSRADRIAFLAGYHGPSLRESLGLRKRDGNGENGSHRGAVA